MKIQTVLDHYKKIRAATVQQQETRLPMIEAQLYTLNYSESHVVDHIDRVYEGIDAAQVTQGWVSFQSKNQCFTAGFPGKSSSAGMLLNAEMVDAHQQSLHIRYNGRSQWLMNHYHYQPIAMENIDNNSTYYIADRVKHLNVESELRYLNYLRFWRLDQQQGMQAFLACFTGFGA